MNTVSTEKRRRKYEMRARADHRRATRDRIVAATVALHREVGPARTTIAAVARRAGVQRLTVYNAFPAARDLFAACQARFLAAAPPPDIAPAQRARPWRGLEASLDKLYEWYEATEAMERHVHRDRHQLPVLDELLRATVDRRLDAVADAHAEVLAAGNRSRAAGNRSRAVRAFVRLALEFTTWDLLARQGLVAREIARMMTRGARAVARGRRPRA